MTIGKWRTGIFIVKNAVMAIWMQSAKERRRAMSSKRRAISLTKHLKEIATPEC